MAEKVYALEEVEKHNKKEDCWLIISGKVYDVTRFLEEHPGGEEVMLMSTGKDATADFEDVGHSNVAQEKMQEFYIGKVDESDQAMKQQHTTPSMSSTPNQDTGDSSNIGLYILTVFMLGIAVFLRYFTTSE